MGDQRTYEQVIALRAIETLDFMTADWFIFEAAFLKKLLPELLMRLMVLLVSLMISPPNLLLQLNGNRQHCHCTIFIL